MKSIAWPASACSAAPLSRRRAPRNPRIMAFDATSNKAATPPAAGLGTARPPYPVPPPPRVPLNEVVILQSFNWESCVRPGGFYTFLESKIPEIKALGITHVWLPPPSASVDLRGYLPQNYYNVNSKYGTKEQLVGLLAKLKEANIAPVADTVINHRCADRQDEHGVWNNFGDEEDHAGNKINWGPWAITSNDPKFGGKGNPDTGADYEAAPDLDHANPELRAALTQVLTYFVRDLGFEGFRLDYARGYAGSFIEQYSGQTIGKDNLTFGEYWTDLRWSNSFLDYNQDAARQLLCDWIKSTKEFSGAIDFPTKGLLNEAFKNGEYDRLKDGQGKPAGLMGWWPSRAVTFIENHDTGSTQKHWPFPDKMVEAGYAYLLTHPGMPCLFSDHVFEWGAPLAGKIKALVELRRKIGIQSDSKIAIKCGDKDMYVAEVTGARGAATLKLGPRWDMGVHLPKADHGWKMGASGEGYAIWIKEAQGAK